MANPVDVTGAPFTATVAPTVFVTPINTPAQPGRQAPPSNVLVQPNTGSTNSPAGDISKALGSSLGGAGNNPMTGGTGTDSSGSSGSYTPNYNSPTPGTSQAHIPLTTILKWGAVGLGLVLLIKAIKKPAQPPAPAPRRR